MSLFESLSSPDVDAPPLRSRVIVWGLVLVVIIIVGVIALRILSGPRYSPAEQAARCAEYRAERSASDGAEISFHFCGTYANDDIEVSAQACGCQP